MHMRRVAGVGSVTALFAALAATLAPATAGAQGPDDFDPSGGGDIRPGVVLNTEGGGECTSNFIFQDDSNTYIGMAAHCAGTGPATATNGCNAGTNDLGTEVDIAGTDDPGTLAYSSWIVMQRLDEQGNRPEGNVCQFNDFALVEIPDSAEDDVDSSVPFFGGPTGLASDVSSGETVFSYGNSPLRLGLDFLSPKFGTSFGSTGDGFGHTVFTLTPGVPGDSGSGFLTGDGEAFGVLSTLALVPVPGSNGLVDLQSALQFANNNGEQLDGDVELVEGTQEFSSPALPLPLQTGSLLPTGSSSGSR